MRVRLGEDGKWEVWVPGGTSGGATYWLDLPIEGAEAALREQARELERCTDVGSVDLAPLAANASAACLLADHGWLVRVTAGR
jgi:hypothetical protein